MPDKKISDEDILNYVKENQGLLTNVLSDQIMNKIKKDQDYELEKHNLKLLGFEDVEHVRGWMLDQENLENTLKILFRVITGDEEKKGLLGNKKEN